MQPLRFEWDPAKAQANLRKHGVGFDEAQSAFADEAALLMADPDHSEEEDRYILLGLSHALRLLVVCHCARTNDPASGEDVLRIISARKATASESRQYTASRS
jgi:uncharacterized protein